jgi:hypothetical protein
MRRSILLVFLVPILIVSASRPASACTGYCERWAVTATPNTGAAPLFVSVNGKVGWAPVIDMNMGGETSTSFEFPWNGDYLCRGVSAQHQFDCPGTYTISVYEHGYPDDVTTTTTVTVSPPSKPYLFAFAGDGPNEAYVATHWYVAERTFAYATVNWGDGTNETFTFQQRGGYFGTPNHLYQADGEYTASITLHYAYQYCSWDESASTVVKVPNPGTPTREQTWGAVKAIYR